MFAHFEAVEADFQSHYGLDLREVLWGRRRFGVRRVMALLNGLPVQGAFYRDAVTDGRYWTTTEELIATLIELTDMTNRLLYGANLPKGGHVWDPIEINRPKAPEVGPPEPPKPATTEEILAVFGEVGEVVQDG